MLNQDFIGKGLIQPLRRDRKSDFASASGVALVAAAIEQVMGTIGASGSTSGELRWDPAFGSLLTLLRHQKNDVALRELAKVYVADAIRTFVPRVRLLETRIESDESSLTIRLRYNLIQRNRAENQVLIGDIDQTVALPLGGG